MMLRTHAVSSDGTSSESVVVLAPVQLPGT
jgi:hypothetical protein